MSFLKLVYQNLTWRLGYYSSLFLVNISIARYFQASVSGWFNYILSVYALVILVASFSLDATIGYFLSNRKISSESMSRLVLVWCLIAGLLGVPIAKVLHNDQISLGLNYFLYSFSFYITGFLLTIFTQAMFYAKHNFQLPNLIAIVFNLFLFLLFLITALIPNRLSIGVFFSIYAGLFFVQGLLLWGLFLFKERIKFLGSFEFTLIKPLFTYSILVFAGNLIFFLVYRIDYWFVNKYCSNLLLGNYIQVSKMIQLFLIIPAGIASVVFVADKRNNTINELKYLTRIVVTGLAVVLVVLVLIGKWFFVWLFGPSFNEMIAPFSLLAPGILSLAVISILGAYLASINMVKHNLIGAVIALVVIIIGDLALVPIWNIKGAALVSTLGYFSYMLYQLSVFKQFNPASFSDFFLIKKNDVQRLRNTALEFTRDVEQ